MSLVESNKLSPDNFKVRLQWKEVSLVNKKCDSKVLDRLSGEVVSSDFLTIMGPSGAGKSSFLSVLTGKLQTYTNTFDIKGKTLLNGSVYHEDSFSQISSYVPQDDLLLETLTIKETFDFQAELKLWQESELERSRRVQDVLRQLNLYEQRNVIVGGVQKKSISGGQKKRVAIGVELLSDPLCLILDEPTSGLDSFNSLKIIKILSKLAKEKNKLIIVTLHQPSTLMFQNLDQLLILNRGQQVYLGKANRIVAYLEAIGVKVDYRMNPCDFYMLELSDYKSSQGHRTLFTASKFEECREKLSIEKQRDEQIVYSPIDFTKKADTVPIVNQFKPLMLRQMKNFFRSPSSLFGRLQQIFVFPILMGLLYFDLLDKIPPITDEQAFENYLMELAAFMFLGVYFTLAQVIYDTMLVFPTEKLLLMKEVHSNMYSLNVYYFSRIMVDLPGLLVPVWISCTALYFIVGLENDFEHWTFFVMIFSLESICGYFLGISTGILCNDRGFAVEATSFVVIPTCLFGGLVANLNSLPVFSSWMQYVFPLKYGYTAIILNQLDTDSFYHIANNKRVQQALGVNGTISSNIENLCLLIYGFFVLSVVMLYFRRKLG